MTPIETTSATFLDSDEATLIFARTAHADPMRWARLKGALAIVAGEPAGARQPMTTDQLLSLTPLGRSALAHEKKAAHGKQ